jgi:hypothetical protein
MSSNDRARDVIAQVMFDDRWEKIPNEAVTDGFWQASAARAIAALSDAGLVIVEREGLDEVHGLQMFLLQEDSNEHDGR